MTEILLIAKDTWTDAPEAFAFRYFMNSYLPARDFISHIEPTALADWRDKQSGELSLSSIDGIYVNYGLLIKHVKSGGNAEQIGLRQGDQITAVNDLKFTEHSLEEIALAVSDAPEKTVTYDVKHSDGTVTKVQNTLSPTATPTISYERAEHQGKSYRYIKIEDFSNENVCSMLTEKLLQDSPSEVAGYIIDLRGNGGGRVDQVVCISGLFIGKGKTIYYRRSLESDYKEPYQSESSVEDRTSAPTTAPVVVLTDGDSASGSEMLAGALRDHARALILGQRTFGKGSVNTASYWDYPTNKLIIWKTSAVFYLPSQLTNNRVGIIPDFVVPWRSNASSDEDFFATSESISANLTKPENEAIRPINVKRNETINACIDKSWILSEEKRLFGTKEQSDYQRFYSLEVLRCMN